MALVVNIGCNLEDCPRTVALAEQYDKVYAAVGLHPEDVKTYTPEGWDMICRLAEHPKVVGIGETGLDYYWDTSTKDAQKVLFEQHIDLAKQLHKPLVIHDREAHGDTLDILKRTNAKEVGGILHAFSGSVEMAMEVIKLGFYIGLGGPVTFKNARKAVEVAQAIPLEYLVIETDCPYMAPVPFRGKRNEPMLVQHTATKIAELRGISVEELIEATYQNGKRIYGIE
jgi:TatD DNase family protein